MQNQYCVLIGVNKSHRTLTLLPDTYTSLQGTAADMDPVHIHNMPSYIPFCAARSVSIHADINCMAGSLVTEPGTMPECSQCL